MTPIYLDQFPPFPIVERHQDQTHLPLTTQANDNSFSCLISFNTLQDEEAICRGDHRYHHDQQQQRQQKESNEPIPIFGSSNHPLPFPTNNNNNNVERSLSDRYTRTEDARGTVEWMSSKMRFMRKMMGAAHVSQSKPRRRMQTRQDQQQTSKEGSNFNTNNYPGGIVRVCSDCNTTKTPLWRSGPRGPKSLCNACGIRQRKARRAIAAAAVTGGQVAANTPTKVQKEKRSSDEDRILPYKKRRKITASRNIEKKHFSDDITIKLSQSSAFNRVFPQDERDAAILLMALSCGLIHG